MLRAFFNYIDHDINKFEKLTACSRGERRAIDRFIKRGGDPFAELEKEGEQPAGRILYGLIMAVYFGSLWLCRPLFLLLFAMFMTWELYRSIRIALTL